MRIRLFGAFRYRDGVPRPKSSSPADHTLPVRFTAEQVRALDRLRRPGETRSAAIRRIFDRVAYAQQVVLAALGEGAAPPRDDPRAALAAGTTAAVYGVPGGGFQAGEHVSPGVVDTASGIVLQRPPQIAEARPPPEAVATRRELALAVLDLIEGGRPGGGGLKEELLRASLGRLGATTSEIDRAFDELRGRVADAPLVELLREATRILGY